MRRPGANLKPLRDDGRDATQFEIRVCGMGANPDFNPSPTPLGKIAPRKNGVVEVSANPVSTPPCQRGVPSGETTPARRAGALWLVGGPART